MIFRKFQIDSTLLVVAENSGIYSCVACNGDSCELAPIDFFLTDIPEGFDIVSKKAMVIQGDPVDIKCSASKYNFSENTLRWYKQTVDGEQEVTNIRRGRGHRRKKKANSEIQVITEDTSKFTVSKVLKFPNVSPKDSGVYVCRASQPGPARRHNQGLRVLEKTTELRVQKQVAPEIYRTKNMNGSQTLITEKGEGVELQCKTRGVPAPEIVWSRNNVTVDVTSDANLQFLDDRQSLRIGVVVEDRDEGVYRCNVSNRAGWLVKEQVIVKVEAPTIFQTNLLGEDKVMEMDGRMTLQCLTKGKPRPVIVWTLRGLPVDSGRANISNSNQTLVVNKFDEEDEGRYECKASNQGGAASAFQWVKLKTSQEHRPWQYNGNVEIPVFIAVGCALVLAIILIVVAKICVSSGRWKAPPTPPTPRLTQFDLPDDEQEAESCRLTLSRDGSPFVSGPPLCHGCNGCSGQCHQCAGCHYNINGIYGCSGGVMGVGNGSVIGVRSGHSPPPFLTTPGPGSTCMSDYSQHTLPSHRPFVTLRRGDNGTLKKKESRSASPRLSAEF